MPWRCRLGLHRWVLWPSALRREPGESPYYCARCGRERLVV
ncbi:hypothetical protein ACUN7V_15665 [Quadrisphaera oryzae]|nr:hypothetical protein [Quadrisphaera sp. RL12-1S]